MPKGNERVAESGDYNGGRHIPYRARRGVWRSDRELADLWGCARRYEPDMSESEGGRLIAGWNEALRRTRSGFGG